MAHPSTFYPRRTRILARDESSLACKHLSAMGLFSCPLLPIPSPLSIPRDGSNPRSTNLYPTPSVFGYPYRDSNSGLIEGLCAMKDRNPTLRPLSAVLSIFHLYYHISGIRNPFFSRNSGSLLTTSRYDPRMERIPWNDGYLLTRISPLGGAGKISLTQFAPR